MSGRSPTPNKTQSQLSGHGGVAVRSRRRSALTAGEPVLPDVYQEMLRESGVGASVARQKRRRVEEEGDEIIDTAWPAAPEPAVASSSEPAGKRKKGGEKPIEQQKLMEEVVEELGDDSDDDDDDDGIDWEDVDLTTALEPKPADSEVLEVMLNDRGEAKKPVLERKKITAIDRRIRLEVHKLHLLCLMAHVSRRNKWCNNTQVQVTPKFLSTCISLEAYLFRKISGVNSKMTP